ncbi:hypothetical protein NDU88_010278 [Pleurodeles waltl]|uniref:Uncharacterized protein n=1 Tax=Pleurodeles waltl TaxID=8319 RepID=A0AAV7RYT0_PLEWA|nr:hypothetical protein NDU88_010278 [Pleurodeles waltl]
MKGKTPPRAIPQIEGSASRQYGRMRSGKELRPHAEENIAEVAGCTRLQRPKMTIGEHGGRLGSGSQDDLTGTIEDSVLGRIPSGEKWISRWLSGMEPAATLLWVAFEELQRRRAHGCPAPSPCARAALEIQHGREAAHVAEDLLEKVKR